MLHAFILAHKLSDTISTLKHILLFVLHILFLHCGELQIDSFFLVYLGLHVSPDRSVDLGIKVKIIQFCPLFPKLNTFNWDSGLCSCHNFAREQGLVNRMHCSEFGLPREHRDSRGCGISSA